MLLYTPEVSVCRMQLGSEPGDPFDYFSDSLVTLYDYHPVSLTTSDPFVYTLKSCPAKKHGTSGCNCSNITLQIPDPDAANWSLHASSIWVSSTYLADHLDELKLENHIHLKRNSINDNTVRILELGASAGLPGILIAKLYSDYNEVEVTVTDYPDKAIMKTLSDNVIRNGVGHCCRAQPHAWGTDPSPLLHGRPAFDVVIAADTLWNPELHGIFIQSLQSTLKRSLGSRAHIVVGLHTGRYSIQSFLEKVVQSGFDLKSVLERQLSGSETRQWQVTRDQEDEKERRKWVIWIQLGWATEIGGFSEI
jgi:nicotinamide N-methyltransferase